MLTLTAAAASSYAAKYEKDEESADNEGAEDNPGLRVSITLDNVIWLGENLPSAPVRPRARVIAAIVVIVIVAITADEQD